MERLMVNAGHDNTIDGVTPDAQRRHACLFDLPAELRLSIYEIELDGLVREPAHAWEARPQQSRFVTYFSLLLASHQVHDEVESLFRKSYAQRTIFHFNTVPELHDFASTKGQLDTIRHARYSIRIRKAPVTRASTQEKETQTQEATRAFIADHVLFDREALHAPYNAQRHLLRQMPLWRLLSPSESAPHFNIPIASTVEHEGGTVLHFPLEDACNGGSRLTSYERNQWKRGGLNRGGTQRESERVVVFDSNLRSISFEGYSKRVQIQRRWELSLERRR